MTPRTLTRRLEHVMGMPISLALDGRHAGSLTGEAAWDAAVASLRHDDAIFSTYRDDSVISRLDRGEIDLDDCPDAVHEVLALGEAARVASGGAFDVRRMDADGRIRLDPSGVVKGWAVERAARHLETLPETDFCLSAGGDMVCRTQQSTSPAWRIGIEDPHRPQQIVAVVPVRDGAVATSGLAHRGAHLVDPRTGAVPAALASVTVVGTGLTWADIDATAAFVLGVEAVTWLTGRGRTGVIVRPDGSVESFGESG